MWKHNDNFTTYEEWLDEKRYISNLDMHNLHHFKLLARFITQTLDKICSAYSNEQIPEYLFEVRHLIINNIPDHGGVGRTKLDYVLKYVEALKDSSIYDISIRSQQGLLDLHML